MLVTSQLGPNSVSVMAYGRQKGKTYPTDDALLRQIEDQKRKAIEALPKEEPPP